jgi:hypothetical protein
MTIVMGGVSTFLSISIDASKTLPQHLDFICDLFIAPKTTVATDDIRAIEAMIVF